MKPNQFRVIFDELPWEDPSPGMRVKTYESGDKQICLVELSKAYVDEEWCTKRHIGCILEGEMEIDFSGNPVMYRRGDGLMILGGEESKHKAKTITDTVSIILIEDA